MKRLTDLPNDALDRIVDFMDVVTFASFRFIYKRTWSSKHLKQHGAEQLTRIERAYPEYPDFGKALSFQKKAGSKCAHCTHTAISFVEWECGHKKCWIPWCPLHVPPPIMDRVECFCLGGSYDLYVND